MSLVHTLEWLLLFGGLAALGFLCSARMGEGFPAKRLLGTPRTYGRCQLSSETVFWPSVYTARRNDD